MATKSSIEWTEMTWNPVTGCSKVSEGCRHCYAERMAHRLRSMGLDRYRNGFKVTVQEDLVDQPSTWKEPRLVFVNSMSDLFHEDVPLRFIQRVFSSMAKNSRHTFQVLTKRSGRLRRLAQQLPWPENVWMGVSVEDQRVISRVDDLVTVPARTRFVSCEPLIGPLKLPLRGVHWVIVGGESGPGARPMKKDWVESLLEQCREADVAFFFKQWGGVFKKRTGRLLDGRLYNEFPEYPYRRDPQVPNAVTQGSK